MAEGKITITILDGGGGSGEKKAREKKEKTPAELMISSLKKISHPLKSLGSSAEESILQALGGGGGAVAAVGWGGMILKDTISMAGYFARLELNRYFTLKEDYMGQNTLTALQAYSGTAKSMLSSIGSSALQGAIFGKGFGPVGVAIGAVGGAVLGGAVSGVKARTETEQKIEQVNMQMNATNMQTQFSATRAGLVNGSRGTEY